MKASIELTPLDQIRHAEAEIARRVAAAREAAERTIAEAHAQAAAIKQEAREKGRHEGEIRYRDILNRAEEQSRAIIAQGQRDAEQLRRRGNERMHSAIHHAISIIINLDEERK